MNADRSMLRPLIHATALLFLLSFAVVLACQEPPQSEDSSPTIEPSQTQRIGHDIPPVLKAPSARDGFAVARYLPAGTLFIAAGDSVQGVMMRLGRQQIANNSNFRAAYRSVVRSVTRIFGYNLIDPDDIQIMGLDPQQPFGAAILDLEKMSVVSFARVLNPARLEESLQGMAKEQETTLQSKTLPDAKLFSIQPDPAAPPTFEVVLRGDYAFIFNNSSGGATSYSQRIATIAPEESLSAEETFKKATLNLDEASHISAVINITSISKMMEREHFAEMDPPPSDETPEELQARLELQRIQNARYELLSTYHKGIEYAVIDFDIKAQHLQMNLRLHHTKDAPIVALLSNTQGSSALQQSLTDPPLLMLAGQLQPKNTIHHLGLFAASAGINLESLREGLLSNLNLDLDAELIPLLSGSAGMAITGDLSGLLSTMSLEEALDALHLTLVLGTTDTAKTSALIEKIALPPSPLAILTSSNDTHGGYTISIPSFTDIHVKSIEGSLVLSTNASMIPKLEAGTGEGFAAKIPHVKLRSLLGHQNATLVALLDHRWLGGLFLLGYRSDIITPPAPTAEASPELLQKWADLQALDVKIAPMQKAKYQEIEKKALNQLRPLGSVALHMNLSPRIIHFQGGLFFDSRDFPAMIEGLFELAWDYINRMRAGLSASDARLKKLIRKRKRLRRAIEKLQR